MNPGVYDLYRPWWCFYFDSYMGGFSWYHPTSATLGNAALYVRREGESGSIETIHNGTVRSYLIPHTGEEKQEFEARHAGSSYINFVAPIVEAYATAANGNTKRALGSLAPFLRNLNGRGRTWDKHMGEVSRWTVVFGWVATVVEPPAGPAKDNYQDEKDSSAGLRASLIFPSAVAWIDINADGCVTEFAFVSQVHLSDVAVGTFQTVTITVYTLTGWQKWEFKADTTKGFVEQRPGVHQTGKKVAEGLYPSAAPKRVPVFFCYFSEDTSSTYPLGKSLIGDVAQMAREVYNTLADLRNIHRRTAFPFLAIPQKSVKGSLEPETEVKIGPGNALGYPSDTGAPGWVQPAPDQTNELRTHCLFIIAAAFRLAGLEVNAEQTSGNGSDPSSGIALQIKSRGFESTCRDFAGNLSDYEAQCLAYSAAILNKPQDATCTYPKRFVLPDSTEELARAVLCWQVFADALPPQAQLEIIQQAISAALSLSDEKLQTLVDLIKAHLIPAETSTPVVGGGAATNVVGTSSVGGGTV